MASAPDLAAVKEFLGLAPEDTTDDAVLQQSLDSALVAQAEVCTYPTDDFGDPSFNEDLRLAIIYRTTRYASRRNSPEGVIGITGVGGDFTATRIPFSDVDVLHLEGPHRKLPIG